MTQLTRALFTLLLLATSSVSAFDASVVEFGLGYVWRHDDFTWKTTNPQVVPLTTSEHRYEDLQTNLIAAQMKLVSYDNMYIRLYADYGWVCSGQGETQLKTGDVLTLGTKNIANKGEVWDIDIAFGYQLSFCYDTFNIIPLIGYSSTQQRLHLTNFTRLVNGGVPDEPPVDVDDYDEHFRSKWNGFWVGVDFEYDFFYCMRLLGGFEYHRACLDGCFTQDNSATLSIPNPSKAAIEACAQGYICDLGLSFDICGNWKFTLLGEYQYWKADDGSFVQRFEGVSAESLQNFSIKWVSWSVSAIAGYSF